MSDDHTDAADAECDDDDDVDNCLNVTAYSNGKSVSTAGPTRRQEVAPKY